MADSDNNMNDKIHASVEEHHSNHSTDESHSSLDDPQSHSSQNDYPESHSCIDDRLPNMDDKSQNIPSENPDYYLVII